MYNEFIIVLLLAGKNPTNLKVHLKTIHTTVFTEMKQITQYQQVNTASTTSTAVTHKCMEQFIVKPQTVTEIARHNELLLNMFIGTGIPTRVMDSELPPPMKRFKFLSRKLTSARSEEQEQAACEPDVNSELQRYHTEIRDTTHLNVDNKFWTDRECVYPILCRLGHDLVAAPGSQAYVETMFSLCGELTARKRNRTRVTLYKRVFLKLKRNILQC